MNESDNEASWLGRLYEGDDFVLVEILFNELVEEDCN